jgi:heme-degrading monooxygenase HmoA
MNSVRFSAALFVLLQACADADPQSTSPERERERDAFEGCVRGELESDLEAAPLAGSAVRDGALEPGQYVVSSTYLQLKPSEEELFQKLIGPIMNDLAHREGLIAISLGTARSCNSARTLTVWRDEAAMLGFVVGDAHAAAMSEIHELSRGGSVVTHWSGDESSVSWSAAAKHLAEDDGPEY